MGVVGYRTQSHSVMGYSNSFDKVLEYETGELGNKDIYYTLRCYGVSLDLRRGAGVLNRCVLDYCCTVLGCGVQDLRCVWLCRTAEDAKRYGTPVDEVVIDGAIVVSDLGCDGQLYVWCGDKLHHSPIDIS